MYEALTLLVNHWHYVRNIDPTCETLTLLVKHWPHLQIVHTMWEMFTDGTPQVKQWPTYGIFYLSQTDLAPVNLWPCFVEHWFHSALTTWWITHTHTHKHTMPWHRAGKAAYLTTIFNTQQCSSLQCSTSSNVPHHNTQRPLKYLTTTLNTQFMVFVGFMRQKKRSISVKYQTVLQHSKVRQAFS